MRSDRAIADELHQLRDSRFSRFLVGHHRLRDARQLHNNIRDNLLRVDHQAQRIGHRSAFKLYRTDFNHARLLRIQAGRFKVQHDHRFLEQTIIRILNNLRFVNQVSFAAGNQLDILLFHRIEGRREGLHHAVIRNRNRRVLPLQRTLDQVARGRHRIHAGHDRMRVQLDALLLRRVLAFDALHRHHIAHGNRQFAREIIIHAFAAQLDVQAHLDLIDLVRHCLALFLGDGRRRFAILNALPAVPHEHLAQNR